MFALAKLPTLAQSIPMKNLLDDLANRYCLELLHFFCVNAVAVRGFQVPEQRPGRCVESQLANRAYHQQQRNNDQNYSHF